MNLTEHVVLITGGSRGLGRAFAQALVAAGAHVAITARGASELHEIAAQLSSAADQVIAIPADVVDPEAAPRVVAETEQRLGPITSLINNAGQFRAFGRIGDLDPLEWWNEVEVNSQPALDLARTRAAKPAAPPRSPLGLLACEHHRRRMMGPDLESLPWAHFLPIVPAVN